MVRSEVHAATVVAVQTTSNHSVSPVLALMYNGPVAVKWNLHVHSWRCAMCLQFLCIKVCFEHIALVHIQILYSP